MDTLKVYCAEIGSVARDKFGWFGGHSRDREQMSGGNSISDLADCVADDLMRGLPIALGFECPLFVLVTEDPENLTSARPGEGARAWSANAGACSLATGLTEVVWLLRAIRKKIGDLAPSCFLNWKEFKGKDSGLFLWEAFVSGEGKGSDHTDDARIAVNSFLTSMPNLERADMMHCQVNEEIVHSLIGAAILRSGWTKNQEVLSKRCIVIKGTK